MAVVQIILGIVLVVGVASLDSSTPSHDQLEQILSYSKVLLNSTSSKCSQQLTKFVSNLKLGPNSWSLQMLDAVGKIPSGILQGSLSTPGDFDECVNIKDGTVLGKYCLGFIVNNSKVADIDFAFTWGLCVPDGCTARDASVIANTLIFQRMPMKSIVMEEYCQTIDDVNKELDAGAIATISVLTVLGIGLLLITSYEIYCVMYKNETYHPIVRGLSCYSNCKIIFKMSKPNPNRFACLSGIRSLSILFVVYFHSYQMLLDRPVRNNLDIINFWDSRISMVIYSVQYTVDSFFILGAALMTYNFLKARFDNVPFNIIVHYIHRYLRLTPSLAMVILVNTTLTTYMGSGPRWPTYNAVAVVPCVDYWWSGLLYIQNFIPGEQDMCLKHTWYLTVEMQLFILSPPFLYLLWKCPKAGLVVLGLTTAGSVSYAFYLAWRDESYAMNNTMQGLRAQPDKAYYYSVPARASSWTIGMILGYCMFQVKQNQGKFQINKILVLSLWLFCLAVIATCVNVGYNLREVEYDKWGNALYIALVRPSWSVAVSWMIFVCCFGYGGPINWFLSLPIFELLATLSYSIYLIHENVFAVYSFSCKTPAEFSLFFLAYEYWGGFAYTVFLSVILVLMIELPAATLEKIIFSCSTAKQGNDNEAAGARDVEATN